MGTERAIEWEPKRLLNCRRRKDERAIELEPKGLLNCRRRKGERAIEREPKGLLNVAIGGKVEGVLKPVYPRPQKWTAT
ncbi:hypothetical protein M513_11068 [Trichuris suis]|uniref:Uncharacterized protein n=1 Tax=Trichuris suis TaxID=68888 RepID=A0A085LSV2_9BILA|nr:hypothetical protein M513_11068 [Trichuris suis]